MWIRFRYTRIVTSVRRRGRRRFDGRYRRFGRGRGRCRNVGTGRSGVRRPQSPLPSPSPPSPSTPSPVVGRRRPGGQAKRHGRRWVVEEKEMPGNGQRVVRGRRPDAAAARFRLFEELVGDVGQMHQPGFGVHGMLPRVRFEGAVDQISRTRHGNDYHQNGKVSISLSIRID